jgi:hypothetical protein
MQLLTMLAGVLVFPWLLLGFLLWMAWLEDTLPASVRRTGRTPDPEPILAIPVAPVTPPALAVPQQRQAPEPAPPAEAPQAPAVSLSTEPSLGGSTNL